MRARRAFSGALVLLALVGAGCTPLGLSRTRVLTESRLAAASPPRALLVWPVANAAGADLLGLSERALVRAFAARREEVVARLEGKLLRAVQDAVVQAARSRGYRAIPAGLDPPPEEARLSELLSAHGADAALVTRISAWSLDEAADVGTVTVDLEIVLLRPDDTEPSWRWAARNARVRPGREEGLLEGLSRLAASGVSSLPEVTAPAPSAAGDLQAAGDQHDGPSQILR